MGMRRRQEPRIGIGLGYWGGTLTWIWPPVFRHCVGGGSLATFRFAAVAPCGSLPPFFRHCVGGGSLATFTQESVITRILRHLKLASVPPPIAPARCRQELFAFDEAHDPWRGLVGNVRVATVYFFLTWHLKSRLKSSPRSLKPPSRSRRTGKSLRPQPQAS